MTTFLIIGALSAMLGYGLLFIAGIFRKLGLSFLADLYLRMLFYDRKAYCNDSVLWNNLWLRSILLGGLLLMGGLVASSLGRFAVSFKIRHLGYILLNQDFR